MSTQRTRRVRVRLTFELEYTKPLDSIPHSLAITDINKFIIGGIQATSAAPEGAVARQEPSRVTRVRAGADASYTLVFPRKRSRGSK